MTNEKNKTEKEFLYYSLRVSFYIMITLWMLNLIFTYGSELMQKVLSFTFMFFVITTFYFSLKHLNRYKNKRLAIIALILSSIEILAFLILFSIYPLGYL